SRWKGQDVVLNAVRSLPDVQVMFVGAAMFGDDATYEEELHAQTCDAGLGDRVRFLGFRDDVAHLMELVDVVAHASVAAEPFGRVLAEAMLAGRPVVATRAGGATEIVRDGVTGLLVTPGSAAELAAAIDLLCRDRAMAHRFAEAGRVHVRAEFDPANIFRRTTAVIAEAVGQSSTTR
ncbi:MAG TPA: glycosyltransferase family 4 protein, partial [Gemmatirosa sp.]